jgi:protein involved in polysaccharide export with SLBB domain
MKHFSLIAFVIACIALNGCGGANNGTVSASAPPPAPTAPNAVDVMRTGDKITVRLTGVPDGEYVIEVQIPASGDITVPLLTRSFHAAGRNSSQVADEISEAYKVDKIYSNPNVTIIPEERFVNVGGDVRGPSRVLYTPDMTLLTAINSCGGFTEYANRKAVRITRGQQIITVNCVQATAVPGTDPALYPGDVIYVPRTIF